jgi:galacturonosyltransferase
MIIAFVGNSDLVLYNFRKEIIERLAVKEKVYIFCPYGKKIEYLINLGCTFIEWNLNRHSINPFTEIFYFFDLQHKLKKIRPSIILSFTIKPNIYTGLYSLINGNEHIPNITGLGKNFIKNTLFSKMLILLYRVSFHKSKIIFLQNQRDFDFFTKLNLFPKKLFLLPGSGVNLVEFKYFDYPTEEQGIKFIYLGRIMQAKGFDLYVSSAICIKKKYPNTKFLVMGFPEKEYEAKLNYAIKNGFIEYLGNSLDVKKTLKEVHCLIQPSYYPEGISNVILEASATGRPVITSNNVGCVDAVIDHSTGIVFEKMNLQSLINSVDYFINLNIEEKKILSENARTHMENNFNRDIVVDTYIKFIYS